MMALKDLKELLEQLDPRGFKALQVQTETQALRDLREIVA
jgi:hypothetical protein